MCGIFGITVNSSSHVSPNLFRAAAKKLFILSGSRGKDASGLALLSGNLITILKRNLKVEKFLKTKDYKKLMNEKLLNNCKSKPDTTQSPTALIGHSRMVTDGTEDKHENNQPLVKNGMVVIHNGIVVNKDKIWGEFPRFKRKTDTDTEVIPELLDHYFKEKNSLPYAVHQMYRKIEGVASIAVFFETTDDLLISTNNGSLYTAFSQEAQTLFFASEKYMLKALFKSFPQFDTYEILHMEPGDASLINISDFKVQRFRLAEGATEKTVSASKEKARKIQDITSIKGDIKYQKSYHVSIQSGMEHLLEDNGERINRLKRCTRCLLPETFPFITFDEKGVCRICKLHKKIEYKGTAALKQLLKPFKKVNKEGDVIIPLSGGRDSTFALHYVKTELDMNPVAYTYDWGMVTDLARRNISRVTAKLGVEHILISADIKKKRRFIRKNVSAWLKRPRLGTLPIFMAGDKQFFYYSNTIKKQMGIDVILFGMNPLERTDFKVGFTGINEEKKQVRHYNLSILNKLRLFFYYGKEYLLNPTFINSSLFDTFWAFISYYFIRHNYHIFYEYFPWDESLVTRTIIDHYDWETSEDTDTTWRIGDGTAAFYNYIYYTVAGFSENDTFRSNQIRQGIITREKAFKMTKIENMPRFESIKWYCNTNGLDFENTIKTINDIPKLY